MPDNRVRPLTSPSCRRPGVPMMMIEESGEATVGTEVSCRPLVEEFASPTPALRRGTTQELDLLAPPPEPPVRPRERT